MTQKPTPPGIRSLLHLVACSLLTLSASCVEDDHASGEDASTGEESAIGDDSLVSTIAVNNSKTHIVVYSNNTENLADGTCNGDGDWDRLFSYLERQSTSPDIFLLQQISNQAQLDALVQRMTAKLPGTYAGKIAIEDPFPWMYCASSSESAPHSCSKSSCSYKKKQQTNAVIYRTDRFSLVDTKLWRSDRHYSGGCSNSNQLRVENVGLLLHDRLADKTVSVASFHWPTDTSDGEPCAAENARESVAAINDLGGTLRILGGDANQSKGTHGWWSNVLDAGFRDPIFETCPSSGCPDSTSTAGSQRIDYLLVKGSHGFSGAKTISEASTGGVYSNHRALRVDVKY